MILKEFIELVQTLESNLNADLSVIDIFVQGYSKYYSDIEIEEMKRTYQDIMNKEKVQDPTSYSLVKDIYCEIVIAHTGSSASGQYPPFGIIETSRYSAAKSTNGNMQAIFIDYGLLWAIQLISDSLIFHLLSYHKDDDITIEKTLGSICGIILFLIDCRIHELSNDFNMSQDSMILASYLQYAMTTFICAHEFVHYIYAHDNRVENEYDADLQGAILTLKVLRNKIHDDRIGVLGIIVLFLFLSILDELEYKVEDGLLNPKIRLKRILDQLMPDWLVNSKNVAYNIVDKLFGGESVAKSLDELYNEVNTIFGVSLNYLKGWRS